MRHERQCVAFGLSQKKMVEGVAVKTRKRKHRACMCRGYGCQNASEFAGDPLHVPRG